MLAVCRSAAALVLLLALGSCSEIPTESPSPTRPSFAIADGAHGGNPHVFFLPPMVPDPSASYSAGFDPSVDLRINICVWSASNSCTATIATFGRDKGAGSELVRIPPGEEYYLVNWQTRGVVEHFRLGTGERYRVRVVAGSQELAYADVEFVRKGGAPGGADGVIRLTPGQTLPVKVRIEEGWDATPTAYPPVAGGAHTCRLTAAGAAWCWGYGYFGQLGDGNFYTGDPYGSPAPVAVGGGHTFVSLIAGLLHTCGLTAAGEAWCWGLGDEGQLGDGVFHPAGSGTATPVAVVGGHRFLSLTATDANTCGISTAGAAYCWGRNSSGQLGNGAIANWPSMGSATPVAVTGGFVFSSLSAGRNHVCGVVSGGAAWCWGANYYGQLGSSASFGAESSVPVVVSSGLLFTSVAGGDYHTCGVTTAGEGYCWGSKNYGQAGTGAFGDANGDPNPTPVAGGLAFAGIDVGDLFSCGLTTAGVAWCWGYAYLGQLGHGVTPFAEPGPVAVIGGHTFTSLSVGGSHSCGLATDGIAYCWGSNGNGELGDGTVLTQGPPWGVATPVAASVAPPGGW